ncbi:hypothetical protein ACUNV4_13330 [Granulosicoccus sp. 3-233]|uniref:hypothetical protein n=1 Tax=Granulosicoccus sp. 3-233 TaxID=3417969 RepID=UPI003D332023
MALFNRSGNNCVSTLTILSLSASLVSLPAVADVWVFEPSISLDQRFDDNYYLIPAGDGSLSATRAVGELGLSRESQATSYRGLVRVDGLLTTSNDNGDEGLDSNQIAAAEAVHRTARSRYGVLVTFTQDTPSRDIAADLSDSSSLASDTGLDLTQSSNVARQEWVIEPSFEYDLTRRLAFDSQLTYTTVDHDLPDPQDAIYRRYIDTFPRSADGSFDGVPLSYNEVTIDDVGSVFTPSGELDDFEEAELEMGFRYKYTPITTFSVTASYSHYTAEVEPDTLAFIPFEDLISDPDEKDIRRKARRDSISTTATFKLGIERFLTRTLLLGVDGGVYTNTTDLSDTLRATDIPEGGSPIPQESLDALETETDGWLASVSLTYDAGVTRYAGKFAVDVEPSSSGTQVETHELTGTLDRVLSPRLNLSVRARAYEPDRLGAISNDRFARRFISFQPKIEWKASRNWTVSAAYRYRRQKAQIDPVSAESNAILLALKYTPPSEVRDAAEANGL